MPGPHAATAGLRSLPAAAQLGGQRRDTDRPACAQPTRAAYGIDTAAARPAERADRPGPAVRPLAVRPARPTDRPTDRPIAPARAPAGRPSTAAHKAQPVQTALPVRSQYAASTAYNRRWPRGLPSTTNLISIINRNLVLPARLDKFCTDWYQYLYRIIPNTFFTKFEM